MNRKSYFKAAFFFSITLAFQYAESADQKDCETWSDALDMSQQFQAENFQNCVELAKDGDLKGQRQVSNMYQLGIGTEPNEEQAVHWEDQAAEQWHADRQIEIAAAYMRGTSRREENQSKGAYFYQLAAKNGSANAQNVLGSLYERGTGVIQDYETAYMWLNIAAANGSKLAGTDRDRVARLLSKQELLKAQSRARDCINSDYAECD